MSPAGAEAPSFTHDPTPPVTLVLTILLLVMFFVGFFSIYFCRCFMDNLINSLNNRQTPNGTPINPAPMPSGLDRSIVDSYPTFPYSSVKDYRREKYGLECAICLCEFDDNDMLRLLTNCCHVFHQECIDLWFESHKSCPVCRRNLDESAIKQSPEVTTNVSTTTTNGLNNNVSEVDGNESTRDDAISITIKSEEEGQASCPQKEDSSVDIMSEQQQQQPYIGQEKFSRSHSTGHSILRNNAEAKDDDKYTLRVPEHVLRRHAPSLSCTTFGAFPGDNSTKKKNGFGEISSCATCQDANKVI